MAIQRHTRENYPSIPRRTVPAQKNIHQVIESVPLQKNVRPTQIVRKEPAVPAEHILVNVQKKIELITETKPKKENKVFDYYLGFGGAGDALLVLAVAYNNPNGLIVFFGNDISIPLIKDLFRTFKITSTVMSNIMGKPMANVVFNRLKRFATFKESAHLADGLYYEDWRNEKKYIPRIINNIPEWRTQFGLMDNNIVVISPSGSHRDIARQRYLTRDEYKTLVKQYLSQGYEVYGIGSDRDFREYFFQEKGMWWATNRILRDWKGKSINHNLNDMLRIINSAKEVISMDTWLKTYSMIAGVPTTVIATRWNGGYKPYGEDVTDWVFLNKNIWPTLRIARIEELL